MTLADVENFVAVCRALGAFAIVWDPHAMRAAAALGWAPGRMRDALADKDHPDREVAREARQLVKERTFAERYGMGAKALARALDRERLTALNARLRAELRPLLRGSAFSG